MTSKHTRSLCGLHQYEPQVNQTPQAVCSCWTRAHTLTHRLGTVAPQRLRCQSLAAQSQSDDRWQGKEGKGVRNVRDSWKKGWERGVTTMCLSMLLDSQEPPAWACAPCAYSLILPDTGVASEASTVSLNHTAAANAGGHCGSILRVQTHSPQQHL